MPVSKLDNIISEVPVSVTPAWKQGLEPIERVEYQGRNQGFIATIVVLMLLLCISFRSIQHIWHILVKRTWKIRLRDDFDQFTGRENRTVALLLIVTVFFIGVTWAAGMDMFKPSVFEFSFQNTLILAGLTAAYFIFQLIVYEILGFTFISPEGRKLWVEGFVSSMAVLGITLLLPGLIILFYPDLSLSAIIIAGGLYLTSRIIFIYKGFRIFYTNIGSCVYFILYLCSLEVIPLSILYFSACALCVQ